MITTKQKNERSKGIGGSDAGAIMGVNPFKKPVDLALEKLGLDFPAPKDDFKMRLGSYLESFLRSEYHDRTGYQVWNVDSKTYVHDKYNFLYGHVDGLIDIPVFKPDTTASDFNPIKYQEYIKAILEIKTCFSPYSKYKFKEQNTDQVPEYYLYQAVHYCAVLGLPKTVFFVLIDGECKQYFYERNFKEEVKYIEKAVNFWLDVCKLKEGKATHDDVVSFFEKNEKENCYAE